MKTLLPLILVAVALAPLAPTSADSGSEPSVDPHRAIFYAVLEGLYQDGVKSDMVERFLFADEQGGHVNFIRGCPLCAYAVEALRLYEKRPRLRSWKVSVDSFGNGLSEAMRKRIASDDDLVRLGAINELLDVDPIPNRVSGGKQCDGNDDFRFPGAALGTSGEDALGGHRTAVDEFRAAEMERSRPALIGQLDPQPLGEAR